MMELEDMPEGVTEAQLKDMGMYAKYDVIKRSTGELVTEPVFVLKPDSDPLAHRALALYAEEARQAGYGQLATDIEDWLLNLRRKEMTADQAALEAEREQIMADRAEELTDTPELPEEPPIDDTMLGWEHGDKTNCANCKEVIEFYSQNDQQFWKHTEGDPEDGHVPQPEGPRKA